MNSVCAAQAILLLLLSPPPLPPLLCAGADDDDEEEDEAEGSCSVHSSTGRISSATTVLGYRAVILDTVENRSRAWMMDGRWMDGWMDG
jgi:hypothetical protein